MKIRLLLFALLLVSINFYHPSFCDIRPKGLIYIRFKPERFTSIQEAINSANQGDTIYVPSGVYREHVVVNKSVSVKGQNSAETIIDGGGGGIVVKVTADNSEISGFTVRNGLYGFYVNKSRCVNISLNIVEDNVYGIYFSNSEFCQVFKNNFTGNSMSIVLQDSNLNIISENNLLNNYGQSISLYNSSHNFMACNLIRNNPAFAIYLEKSMNNTLVRNNVSSVCQGISLQYSENNFVSENIVKETGPYAITLECSNKNRIHENILIDNEIALQLLNSHANFIWKNNISKSKLGLWLSRSNGNILRNNSILGNWLFGNFGVYGEKLEDFLNDIDVTNMVDGLQFIIL